MSPESTLDSWCLYYPGEAADGIPRDLSERDVRLIRLVGSGDWPSMSPGREDAAGGEPLSRVVCLAEVPSGELSAVGLPTATSRIGANSVYIPASFAETDQVVLHDFMRQHSFATLVCNAGREMIASNLPLLLDSEAGPAGHLLGHMARANPQWRQVDGEVMVLFSGPHAYISPSWYETPGTVPTWNYVAVHAYGNFRIVEDRDELLAILHRSVSAYESPRPEPWRFDAKEPQVENLLKAIVGFRIEITRLEGKWKLGQNHPEERRRKVIRALSAIPDDDSREIARLMSKGL